MGSITKGTNCVTVKFSPGEILGRRVVNTGEINFAHAISRSAWEVLMFNDQVRKLIKGKHFKHTNVDFLDGEFVCTFHEETPQEEVPNGEVVHGGAVAASG